MSRFCIQKLDLLRSEYQNPSYISISIFKFYQHFYVYLVLWEIKIFVDNRETLQNLYSNKAEIR